MWAMVAAEEGRGSHFLFAKRPPDFFRSELSEKQRLGGGLQPTRKRLSITGNKKYCGRRRTDQSEGSVGTDAASSD